ncbi:esterase-like activity of phytase family protein [Limnohabitans sp. Rim8]|uniref:esterase-like activity of phytase family protein n=1 Tax=Limnohabitans sp. Rim8 TaxID=1100718 RepID=UPI00260F1F6A|nr:esterase-like activity of phytase family protein [Limnohabitans sp. Rim8]
MLQRTLLSVLLGLSASAVIAQTEVTATLAGHAYLPFNTTATAPKDAGALFETSGKFANDPRQRVEKLGSVAANTFVGDPKNPRTSGGFLPIKGQSVQGFSGIHSIGDGTFLALTDNGFGNKVNSMDALLMVHHVKPDWKSGKTALAKTTFLHDPDRKVPFFINNENTTKRYLTGSDFDVESIQVVGNEWWFGDEFGPYILRTTPQGKVLGVIETVVSGKKFTGPDHYQHARPPVPTVLPFNVRRSGGFEPMAKSADGKKVFPMFEWPLWDAESKAYESHNGKPYTRILELDVASQQYTGQMWKYKFEQAGNVAADFQMVNDRVGLVIERDDGSEGVTPVCPKEMRTDCFTHPAQFKRIYKIDMSQIDADGFVKKVAYIDLTRIANPNAKAHLGGNDVTFALPHLGPEGLTVVDAEHIVVVNDNNFPYSSGRTIGQPDHNEITLLNVKALMDAQ